METKREPATTDIIGMIVGLGGIFGGIARLGNSIPYLPGDVRASPVFESALSLLMAAIGLAVFLIFSVRLLQNIRKRRG